MLTTLTVLLNVAYMSTTSTDEEENSYTFNKEAFREAGTAFLTSVMFKETIAAERVASLETNSPAAFSNGTLDEFEIVNQTFESCCEKVIKERTVKANVVRREVKVFISCVLMLLFVC